MDFKGIKKGDVLHGFEVVKTFCSVYGHDTQAKAHIKCVTCGHERSWGVNILYTGKAVCNNCKKLKLWQDERIGLKFGRLTVTDVRIKHTMNTYALCECGNGDWYRFGRVRNMRSCGCAIKEIGPKMKMTLSEIKELFTYDPDAGTLTERKTGKDIVTKKLNMRGHAYDVKRVCWLLGHGEMPRYKVTGDSLKLCDLISTHIKKKKKVATEGEALHARKAGLCRRDGLCGHYRECGDACFECKCRGHWKEDDDWASRSVARSVV